MFWLITGIMFMGSGLIWRRLLSFLGRQLEAPLPPMVRRVWVRVREPRSQPGPECSDFGALGLLTVPSGSPSAARGHGGIGWENVCRAPVSPVPTHCSRRGHRERIRKVCVILVQACHRPEM